MAANTWWLGDIQSDNSKESECETHELWQQWRQKRSARQEVVSKELESAKSLAAAASFHLQGISACMAAHHHEDPENRATMDERAKGKGVVPENYGVGQRQENEGSKRPAGTPTYSSMANMGAAPPSDMLEKESKEDEVQFRLRKRRAELYRTEVHSINSIIELLEKLDGLRASVSLEGSVPAVRKRDMVRDALVGGVASLFGGVGAAVAKRPDTLGQDPYARMTLPKGLMPAGTVDRESSSLWDMRVLEETMLAAQDLLRVHDRLRDKLESACVQDSLEPVWQAFRACGEALQGGHLEFSKASERALEMIRVRDAANLHDWNDLLSRPTQRVMKYQLFFDELSKDASLAGFQVDSTALRDLAAFMRRLLSGIDQGKSRWECCQTVGQLLQESKNLPERIVSLLHAQEGILFSCSAMQLISKGSKDCLVERSVILFDRCIAIIDSSSHTLKLVEALSFLELPPHSCGEVDHVSATSLEVLQRFHLQQGVTHDTFEIAGRLFTAQSSKAAEFKTKLPAAIKAALSQPGPSAPILQSSEIML